LRTERLELRPHRMSDLDDLYAFHSRPEVVRYVPWPVRDREQTRVALEKKLSQAELTEEGQWLVLAIELRETGTVIGEVLLKWESEADRQGEIGFALHTDYQGKGLAAEAAREMLRVGFDELGLHRIVGILDDRNTASAQLLERLGMRREAHFIDALVFKGEWTSDYVYALLEDEWRRGASERSGSGASGRA
jgi:RimJ/RimL family protein N-acetyltransferase